MTKSPKKSPLSAKPKLDKTVLRTTARKNLKAMRKSSPKHPLREKTRITKYGFSGFFRNIWLSTAATTVMSITLIILFITIIASVVLTNTADLMREKIDITIYFAPGTNSEQLAELSQIISRDANIKSVATATSEEEYHKFLAENAGKTEVLAVLADQEMEKIMIAKMQATMRVKVKNINNLDSIKSIVNTDSLFKKHLDEEKAPTYDVNQIEIATITSWANIARTGGIILGTVFLIISILIIFSTIRMAIFSRREEIYMMKLVGAGKRFIRGPFLIEAEICGIIAGLISSAVSVFGFNVLAPKLADYGVDTVAVAQIFASNQLTFVIIAFVVSGMLIGSFSARLAISKYINKA